MSGALVVIPLSEFENMKKKIERLEKENVKNYIERRFTDVESCEYDRVLDLNAINQDFGPLTFESKHES